MKGNGNEPLASIDWNKIAESAMNALFQIGVEHTNECDKTFVSNLQVNENLERYRKIH